MEGLQCSPTKTLLFDKITNLSCKTLARALITYAQYFSALVNESHLEECNSSRVKSVAAAN